MPTPVEEFFSDVPAAGVSPAEEFLADVAVQSPTEEFMSGEVLTGMAAQKRAVSERDMVSDIMKAVKTGQVQVDDRLAPIIREARNKFPDLISREFIKEHLPGEKESALETAFSASILGGMTPLGPFMGAGVLYPQAKDLGERAAEAKAEPGARMTPLDISTGALSTLGRGTAALWDPELYGESRPEALLRALLPPQVNTRENVRDWLGREQELARRRGDDPTSWAVLGEGIAKDILLDPTMLIRWPTKAAEGSRVLTHLGKLAERIGKGAGHVDPGQLSHFVRLNAANILAKEATVEHAVPALKAMLRKVDPEVGEALVRAFDAEGFAIGRRGIAVTPAWPAGVAGSLTQMAGVGTEFAGAVGGKLGGGRLAGAVEKGGRAVRAAGRGLSKVGGEIEVVPTRYLVKASRREAINGFLTTTPGGKALMEMVGLVDPKTAEVGLDVAGHPGAVSDFDAFAARTAGYVERRMLDDAVAAGQDVAFGELAPLAKVTTAKRRGVVARITGRMARTVIDLTPKRLLEAVREAKPIVMTDDRGTITALIESPHRMALEADEAGLLLSDEDTLRQFSVLERRAKFESRAEAIRTAADEAVEESRQAFEASMSTMRGKASDRVLSAEIRAAGRVEAKERAVARAVDRASDSALSEEIRSVSRAEARQEAVADAVNIATEKAQKARAAVARAREVFDELAKREGELASDMSSIERRIPKAEGTMRLLKEHGLDPQRHDVKMDRLKFSGKARKFMHHAQAVVSIRKVGRKAKSIAGRIISPLWLPIDPPPGLPKGRSYFVQMSGPVDLPEETLAALVKTKSATERELSSLRRKMDVLVGRSSERASVVEARGESRVSSAVDRMMSSEQAARLAGTGADQRDSRILAAMDDLAAAEQEAEIAVLGARRTAGQGIAAASAGGEAHIVGAEARRIGAEERAAGLERRAEFIPKAAREKAESMKYELRNAVKRAYAKSVVASYNDPAAAPAELWGEAITGVERSFGVDLSGTWIRGADSVDADRTLYFGLRNALDERMGTLLEFTENRFARVLSDWKATFGEDSVQELDAYVRHYIRNKDRVMKRLPSKAFMGWERPGKHRAVGTVYELKQAGYDPVEDSMQLLAAAEYAKIQAVQKRKYIRKILGDRRWATPSREGKGLTGATHDLVTHPDTAEEFFVPRGASKSLTRLIEGTGDPGKLERIVGAFERFAITPWKAWATYARPSFHLRNAYSNMWLMWMGGYDMAARPEQMGRALKIGSIGMMLDPKLKATVRKVRRKATPIKDKMRDAFDAKVAEWADETYTAANGTKYTGRQLYEEMRRTGTVNKRWQAADVDEFVDDKFASTRTWDPALRAWKMVPLGQNSMWLRLGAKTGAFVENHARSSLFIDAVLHQGKTPTEAALLVKKHLFDYKELTEVERKLFRRVIPFYAWARKATAHETMSLLQHPERYLAVAKTKRLVESIPPSWDPAFKEKIKRGETTEYDAREEHKRAVNSAGDYIRRRWGWKTWFTTPWGSPIFWDPNMPFQELQKFGALTDIPQGGAVEAATSAFHGFLEQAHPVFKLPMALGTGTKYPQRRGFNPYHDVRWLTEAQIRLLGGKVITSQSDGDTSRPLRLVDERWAYALENALPHVAVWSRLLAGTHGDPFLEEKSSLRKFREASGVGAHPVNPMLQRRYGAQAISRELRQYTRPFGRFVPKE